MHITYHEGNCVRSMKAAEDRERDDHLRNFYFRIRFVMKYQEAWDTSQIIILAEEATYICEWEKSGL